MRILALWIWFCAVLNCAGWALSVFHQLTGAGYVAVLFFGLVSMAICKKKGLLDFPALPDLGKWRRRFARPFPLAFLLLTAMALAGGILYPPSNYDALAYRVPRVLHWLAAGQWHWISSCYDRLNDRSCGIEWVSAPVLAIFGTDRFLFLINIVSFLFLPGLVFGVFTNLGVRRRVAWYWMWLVPTAYGLLLQAGSIGNDLFGAVFALAAVGFALRANKTGRLADVFTSVFAAAMMTSAKTSNLPLLLPWAVALLPSLKLALRRPLAVLAVAAVAALASALPTIVCNIKYSGDWSGAHVGQSQVRHAALVRGAANVVLLALENLAPPVFPGAPAWNRLVEREIPPKLGQDLAALIEAPGCRFALEQMQIEEHAGFGCGLSLLLLASVIAGWRLRRRPVVPLPVLGLPFLVSCSAWAALAAVLLAANMSTLARLVLPYYALLLPLLLAAAGQGKVVRQAWWRYGAAAVFVAAGVLLVVSPARPLFPVMTVLGHVHNPPARVVAVYSTYRNRPDAMAPAREFLPAGTPAVGLVAYDALETSLWRPFGHLRVEHVIATDTAADLKARGVEYVLFIDGAAEDLLQTPLAEWLESHHATVVRKFPLYLRARTGPADWYLVKLN